MGNEPSYNQYWQSGEPDLDDDEWDEFPESSGLVDSYRLYEFPEELIDLGELL